MGTIPLLQTVGALAADRSPSPVYQTAAQGSARKWRRVRMALPTERVKWTAEGVVHGGAGSTVGVVTTGRGAASALSCKG